MARQEDVGMRMTCLVSECEVVVEGDAFCVTHLVLYQAPHFMLRRSCLELGL